MRHAALVLSPLLALLWVGRAVADEPAPKLAKEPGALALTTERVVVFKDGFALFVKRAEGSADAEGRVFTEEVPDAAVLGTFWATSSEGKILAMHAGWRERPEVTPQRDRAVTMVEILRANAKKQVVLGFTREGVPELRATIVEVLETWDRAPAARHAAVETTLWSEPRGGTFVVLQREETEQVVILPVAEIRSVSGAGLDTTIVRVAEKTVRTKRLTFDLGAEAAGKPATLRLLYFRPGMRWFPTYRLSGDLEERGELALQGEIVNEAEDVAGAALDLVVGVPNFRYRDVVSPLTLETALRGVLSQDERAGQILNQNIVSNRFSNEFGAAGADGDAGAEALRMAPELAAAQGQDLFVYSTPRLSLKRGERATLALWQVGVPLRHVYTYDIALVRDPNSGARGSGAGGGRGSPLRMSRNDVWHQMEIPNGTETPWTTGAVLLLRGELPLGQEMLGYTPRGGRVLVPVTVAIDVQGTHDEREIERRANAVNLGGHLYTVVRKRIEVSVTNRRSARSDVRISVSTGGRAENPNAGGKVHLDDFHAEDWPGGGSAVNNHSTVTWNATIEPGATTVLTCEVEFYLY